MNTGSLASGHCRRGPHGLYYSRPAVQRPAQPVEDQDDLFRKRSPNCIAFEDSPEKLLLLPKSMLASIIFGLPVDDVDDDDAI